jgi:hypothetical protein
VVSDEIEHRTAGWQVGRNGLLVQDKPYHVVAVAMVWKEGA